MADTLPPFLTGAEVDELCKPIRQRSAQVRRLCALLGMVPAEVPRRPDGLPLVGRKLVEQKLNHEGAAVPGGIRWSKA